MGAGLLDRLYAWAIRSGIDTIKYAAGRAIEHLDGILTWLYSRIVSGLIEDVKFLVQAAEEKPAAPAQPAR